MHRIGHIICNNFHFSYCKEIDIPQKMGNSGSLSEDKKKNYNFDQDGRKGNKKKAEESSDLWIPTPTTTSVFSELDKHSYAAEILEENLNPIKEENEDEGRDYSIAVIQNGKVSTGEDIDFTMKSKLLNAKVTQPENLSRCSNKLVYHHKQEAFRSEGNISKSIETLTFGHKDMNDNTQRFSGVRYSATLEGNTHYKSNPAINTIPFATLVERAPPQRSSSMKLQAGPWQHQKPSYGQLPQLNGIQDPRQRNKVARRSSWTPSTSRFKKIFLLNKPEGASSSRPVRHRSLSDQTGEKCYHRTAEGQIMAVSPESTLRTSQWVAEHSNKIHKTTSSQKTAASSRCSLLNHKLLRSGNTPDINHILTN